VIDSIPPRTNSLLRLIAATICCSAGFAANAQVEWFVAPTREGGYPWPSLLYTRAYATASDLQRAQQSQCAMANVPSAKGGAWKQIADECPRAPQLSARDVPYELSRTVTLTSSHGTITSSAEQTVIPMPTALRVSAKVATSFSGTYERGFRAQPVARGELYFRVPEGRNLYFRFNAQMTWTGKGTEAVVMNRGGFQLYWVPNTIKDMRTPRQNFSSSQYFDYAKLSTENKPAKRTGVFVPGVYIIAWSVANDVGGKASEVSIDLELDFGTEKHCVPPLSGARTEDILAEDARLFGPYQSVNDAALAAAAAVITRTRRFPIMYEYGMLILKDKRAPSHYYFPSPVWGHSADLSEAAADPKKIASELWEVVTDLWKGSVTWRNYTEGRDRAFLRSCKSSADFEIAATAHSHPSYYDMNFSAVDFSQSVQLFRRYPGFEKIVLFTSTDGCTRAFEPERSDDMLPADAPADDPKFKEYRERTATLRCGDG
jgi:hypothetical protein